MLFLAVVLLLVFSAGVLAVRLRPRHESPISTCAICGARFLHQRGLVWHAQASHPIEE